MHCPEYLNWEFADSIRNRIGTPFFLYDEETTAASAKAVSSFPAPYGFTPRFAMKANSNAAFLRFFGSLGFGFDASSGFEVKRALRAGIAPERISLSSQELPGDIAELLDHGVTVNACSLEQLARIGCERPGGKIGLRINPGKGSGATRKTNTGGPSSSFGIWHEWVPQARQLAEESRLSVVRIHTHIGSGTDPEVWKGVAVTSLDLLHHFPDAERLNLGGGFKVARVEGEKDADLEEIGSTVRSALERFAATTGRQIHLEIEPGTYLVAKAGYLISTIQDIVSTGEGGYEFLKLDCGMTEILRPSLYGSQHLIGLLQSERVTEESKYVVVGHCCESGDLLTPAPGQPDVLDTRLLPKARCGDLAWIGGSGAYCASMATTHYNSFPQAAEVWVDRKHRPRLIRRRNSLEEILAFEVDEPL